VRVGGILSVCGGMMMSAQAKVRDAGSVCGRSKGQGREVGINPSRNDKHGGGLRDCGDCGARENNACSEVTKCGKGVRNVWENQDRTTTAV
jgi:hypothetical protein